MSLEQPERNKQEEKAGDFLSGLFGIKLQN
jgi:hypothetical protein